MAPALLSRRPKILFLDAYDSFSNNIVAQVEQNVDADITQIHIDDPIFLKLLKNKPNFKSEVKSEEEEWPTFAAYLKTFNAVIAGPGPGWANQDVDVGLMKELWELQDTDLLPVLGICLGFQSMALAFGANIRQLNEPRHGIVSEILHKEGSIFSGVGELTATQYHSLQVDIGHPIQKKRAVAYPGQLWKPTEQCPSLEPLAWDFDSRRNGAVLMAAKHVQKPFWGVQFHPESICTNHESDSLIQNWWASAQAWNRGRLFGKSAWASSLSPYPSLSSTLDLRLAAKVKKWDQSPPVNDTIEDLVRLMTRGDGKSLPDIPPNVVHCVTAGSGRLTVSDICEAFDIPSKEAIVLESGLQPNLLPLRVGTGRYSIIGLVIPNETLRIEYYAGSQIMQLRDANDKTCWQSIEADAWQSIKMVMQHLRPKQVPSGPTFAPFWGGLMGYASYEAGLETIDVQTLKEDWTQPDICFAYITRSIVFDHQVKKIYIQSIRGPDDQAWVEDTREKIYQAARLKSEQSTPNPTPMPKPDPFDTDTTLDAYLASCRQYVTDRAEYCRAVAKCQGFIANGHSYELCLTTQNKVTARKPNICKQSLADNNELSWKLYKRLTKQNPAPFSAYVRLRNVHILSSSPERYISWDRTQTAQCRPIKGTVQKRGGVTAADAHAILSSSKERAENLMIVDLVRHQLHGVYGAGNVNVSQLMQVEEYETLWQLVSVIDAIPRSINKPRTPEEWEDPVDYMALKTSSSPSPEEQDMLGFDAFVKSLPPGSMTGAPKKRSCEILQSLENRERRGIYSGVLGYFDVGGGGDFSVVIRTAVKVDSEDSNTNEDEWRFGAGGAITAQSDPEAEYEEMLGKFVSTVRAFNPDVKPQNKIVDVIGEKNPLSELAALVERGAEGEGMMDIEQVLRALARAAAMEEDIPTET